MRYYGGYLQSHPGMTPSQLADRIDSSYKTREEFEENEGELRQVFGEYPPFLTDYFLYFLPRFTEKEKKEFESELITYYHQTSDPEVEKIFSTLGWILPEKRNYEREAEQLCQTVGFEPAEMGPLISVLQKPCLVKILREGNNFPPEVFLSVFRKFFPSYSSYLLSLKKEFGDCPEEDDLFRLENGEVDTELRSLFGEILEQYKEEKELFSYLISNPSL